ncbi:aromatic prenyltransferase [Actinacidiphila rubida]|uniref:Aromatic prenyltransferase Orf2 n=1 Tax=Actinacidiphila rubida TaxID=310780 RepID=A0A1H8R5X4_9ACTN|nr:aromatic prenyltransferase [Actinacidiphila rubida]SEO62069.1 Aromatic prenyltransferase Orf2 [Actinacidiphila rubida]
MPGASKTEAVYAAIEEASGLLGVPCSREKVQQVLGAFGEGVSEESVVVLAMAGGERYRGDIDYNFTVPTEIGDPYKIAVANGLLEADDHPAGRLGADIAEHCRVSFFGVEAGVVGGFKKTYVFFPLDELGSLSKLAEIDSMPPSVAEHAAAFARNGMDDRISIVGIDYLSQTMNVYFMAAPVDQKLALDLLEDLELPAPSPDLLEFIPNSFSIYPTYSWDSSQIKRICFSAVSPDQSAYPTTLHPEIATFARNAPYEYGGARVLVYGATITRGEEYHKLGAYFRRPAAFWNSLPLAATFERLAAEQAAAGK